MRILVTGGAGFIGSFIVDELVNAGIEVIVIDSLEAQVHHGNPPSYLNPAAKYHWTSLANEQVLNNVLARVDAVCHQAALVGVGQSMYEISRYCNANIQQTALLAEKISRHKHIKKFVIASSMSVYGEGKYRDRNNNIVRPLDRELYARDGSFNLFDGDGYALSSVPVNEEDAVSPYSIYGTTKLAQERLAIIMGKAYDIPTIAFRYFGVYGPRQSLSNPYAGLMALFAGRLLNGRQPLVFEDGHQTRDFIYVTDVAKANLIALTKPGIPSGVYNLTSGVPVTVLQVADILCNQLNPGIRPNITYKYRKGDIRHCFGDVSKIEAQLGFKASINIDQGLHHLAEWVAEQKSHDLLHQMEDELNRHYLLVDNGSYRSVLGFAK